MPAQTELTRALAAMLGSAPSIAPEPTQDGGIVFGTPRTSAPIARLHPDLEGLGAEGYLLRSATLDGHRVTMIAANSDCRRDVRHLSVLYACCRRGNRSTACRCARRPACRVES